MLFVKRLLKRKILVLGLLALMFTANAQNSRYIFNHKFIATVLSQHYGIPASVILSVAAIESSGGTAPVARVLNNHFGMEGKNGFVNKKGHKSRYKQYDNEIASYIDFCEVVSRKSFYSRLKDNANPRIWVKALSRCGYSEVPEEWEHKVFSVLNTMEYSSNLASR
jgi:Bax protein